MSRAQHVKIPFHALPARRSPAHVMGANAIHTSYTVRDSIPRGIRVSPGYGLSRQTDTARLQRFSLVSVVSWLRGTMSDLPK